ncbi:sugar phosphate nucleotidyltransferase [Calditrichota bacterium]
MKTELLIRIYSFSFRDREPIKDPTGNGGGFVFDCRALPNPFYIPHLAPLTGLDSEVAEMLSSASETSVFLDSCKSLTRESAKRYNEKGYNDLSISFGCTGGKHRSVYCAEQLSNYLTNEGFKCRVVHWQLEKDFEQYRVKRAMILAAGFGTRLKGLTDDKPKALIEAGGCSMLDWTMTALMNAGCREVAINAHHHAVLINEWYQTATAKYPEIFISVSYEKEILGTGGGIKAAARWLHGSNPFMVHNVDIWTDFNLSDLLNQHNPTDMATLVCQERESSSYLLVDAEMRICGVTVKGNEKIVTTPHGNLQRLGFTGIHICSPLLLDKISEMDRFSIIDTYLDLIADEKIIRALKVEGNWFDMGTPEKLERLNGHLSS